MIVGHYIEDEASEMASENDIGPNSTRSRHQPLTNNDTQIRRIKLRVVEGDINEVLWSDAPRQIVFDRCPLCLTDEKLQLSHIAPKWAYRWMKEEGAVLHHVNSEGYVAHGNDGDKQYLLCAHCEQRLGIYEKHLADFSKGGADRFNKLGIHISTDGLMFGASLEKITKALMGILFKAQFARTSPWVRTQIPAHWTDYLRRFLLGDIEACIIQQKLEIVTSRFFAVIDPDINPKAILTAGLHDKNGCWRFELIIGGWIWRCFFLRSPDDSKRPGEWNIDRWGLDAFRTLVLQQDQPWTITHADILVSDHINPDHWRDVPDHDGFVSDTDKCPCGLGNFPFAKCCKPVWYRDTD